MLYQYMRNVQGGGSLQNIFKFLCCHLSFTSLFENLMKIKPNKNTYTQKLAMTSAFYFNFLLMIDDIDICF